MLSTFMSDEKSIRDTYVRNRIIRIGDALILAKKKLDPEYLPLIAEAEFALMQLYEMLSIENNQRRRT